ncbi:MAG: hypothetical protein H7Y09_08735 [Chitinophagaceae bacterium]|nr:hypothetical protein [Anaerolineae bacterium]
MVDHDALAPVDYLLVGHLTADLTPDGRQLGGTASYGASTAHAFGLRVGVLTSARQNDPLLEELRQWAQVVVLPSEFTTTYENIYAATGRTQYVHGVAAPILPEDVPAEWRSTPLVHIAPMADEIHRQIVSCFPESALLVTLQGWLRRWEADGRVRFKRWYDQDVLNAIDFIVFSEEDIAEAADMEAKIAEVARCLIVTRADKGGTIYREGQAQSYGASSVEVAHPTGAGDIFATSFFICWHLLKHDIDRAVRAAAILAGHSVTRIGLQSTPTPDEIRAVLNDGGI